MLFVMNRTSFRCCMPAHLFVPLILRQWPGHSAAERISASSWGLRQRKEGSASGRGLRQQKGVSASSRGLRQRKEGPASSQGLRQRKEGPASSRGLRQRLVLFFVPLALSENLSSPLEAALVLYSFHSLLNENLLCSFGSLKMVLLCL